MAIKDISFSGPVHLLNGRLSLRENDTCLKYSENPEALKKLLSEIVVSVKVIGKDFYFDGDKEERLILRVYITREKEEIAFRFGMSVNDTEAFTEAEYCGTDHMQKIFKRRKVKDGLLYSLLSCCASDYSIPDTFEEFCSEFGYDTDSRKAEKLFHDCQEQSKRLRTIFKEEEIDCLPR